MIFQWAQDDKTTTCHPGPRAGVHSSYDSRSALVTPAPEPGSIPLMTREARLKAWIPGQARDDKKTPGMTKKRPG